MKSPSLEESCLVKLAVSFWTREHIKRHVLRQANGFVQMETALEGLKDSASALPLAASLRRRLNEIIERVGYELYVFMTRSPASDLQNELDLRNDIKWNALGIINERVTYARCFDRRPAEKSLSFKCASVACDEEKIMKIWPELSDSDRERLKNSNLLASYWMHSLEGRTDHFIASYGYSILGFDPYRSVEYNMLMHCLNSNLKFAMEYFWSRLEPPEKELLTDGGVGYEDFHLTVLRKVLKSPRQENFKYVASFLEIPLPEFGHFELIAKEMPSKSLEDFICYLLRQVNLFGDLHYNLFRRLVSMARSDVKLSLVSKLDFFVLNLMAKGRLETFERLLTRRAKSVLHEQLSYRLKQSKGLAPFFTICRNNQSHLLRECFKVLSRNKEDENFFSSHLEAILNGSHYDDL